MIGKLVPQADPLPSYRWFGRFLMLMQRIDGQMRAWSRVEILEVDHDPIGGWEEFDVLE